MGKLQDFLSVVGRHKYVVTIGVFLLIICFLDQNNLMQRWQHRMQRVALEREIEYYEAMRDSSVQGLKALERDRNNLERVAREKYGMHLPGEEIFIIK
ncbi:MAG: septum formation initiator family protein [Bacteroidaceae bacterium]|nr:septum formation initiator family protein [Bacteroidaceae bacterium]